MKKIILNILFFIILGLGVSSCIKHDLNSNGYYNQEVIENVDNVFGNVFPETQDWCTTINSSIKVYVNSNDEQIKKVQVLLSNVTDSVCTIKLLNQAYVSNNEIVSFMYDTPKSYTHLFVAFVTDSGRYIYKKFNINDKEVYYNDVDKSKIRKRVLSQNYIIPSINSVIDGTVETFANKRNWLSGEVFYTVNYQTLNSNDYDDNFKSIFRSIIFNYFPNGRQYNNIKKIKDSGYFNESAYPITTGEEPIIVSPIYKNDGGYHEISEAELYYYYFKGNPTVQEIEALPKYKAIDLSEVYTNDNNNNIQKSKSYVLAYFGDNVREIGSEGSYQFPQGYKIGFCYKSNTTSDNKKKQGELYGDGRLNYNINSYGNFKTSNLGPTDPRMGWASVEYKNFLCIESGTDADFNDLIIEVEGGIIIEDITPIKIDNQYYTFCFEDNRLGDYDMNDVVLKGTRLDDTHIEWTLMATGAMDNLYIYNIEGKHIKSTLEVHDIFGKPNQFVNTLKYDQTPYVIDTIVVNKDFSFLSKSNQPYIYDKNKNWFIEISRKGEDPHAIMIPYDFRWPLEMICIKDAYLEFNNWGMKLIEDTDWYKHPEDGKVY